EATARQNISRNFCKASPSFSPDTEGTEKNRIPSSDHRSGARDGRGGLAAFRDEGLRGVKGWMVFMAFSVSFFRDRGRLDLISISPNSSNFRRTMSEISSALKVRR